MRDDIYARLGATPGSREQFLETFAASYRGDAPSLVGAALAAWRLREVLEDVDRLVHVWAETPAELKSRVPADWRRPFTD